MSNIIIKGQTIYGPNIVTDGLVSYFDVANKKTLPTTTSSVWYDMRTSFSGNVFLYTYTSEYGGGISYAGSGYAALPSNNLNADFTYEFITKKTSNTTPTLLGGNFSDNLLFTINSDSISVDKWNVGNLGNFGAGSATNINQVYFITIGLLKSTNTLYCYINGQFVSTLATGAQTYQILGQQLNRKAGATAVMSGTHYVCRFYSKLLSSTEVLQNYNALKGRFGL